MANCVGASSDAPGCLLTGSLNPAQFATSFFETDCVAVIKTFFKRKIVMTNLPSMNHPATSTVEFRGAQLITIKQDDIEYVAMRPVVEAIGISWQGQQEKLRRNKEKFSCQDILTTGKDGKAYNMLCIPITKFNGWAFSINTERIPDPEVRKRVELYQEECFLALHDYWHKGIAERKPVIPETLTSTEQYALTSAVKSKAAGNGKAIPEIWGRVKNRFRVAKYDQITRDRFQEALEYINGIEVRTLQPKAPEAPVELLLEVERLKTKNECLEAENSRLYSYLEKSDATFVALCREVYAHARMAR